jgi:molybdopterin molybdotransferase
VISVEDALAAVLALAAPPEAEEVSLRHAAGRVLIAPARALRDQPPFAASAMDGYAIGEADHSPDATLRVVGEAAAGRGWDGTVAPGTAVRIFTGAPVPDGADRVVLQEDVTRVGDSITLTGPLETATNIRPRGQDFRRGDEISAPRRLSANDVALLASMNIPAIAVARRPVLALIPTGDELVMPGETPGPDQIIASNSFALSAMAEAAGAEVRMLPIAADTVASLRTVLEMAEGADLIVTIGGASVGDHDLVGQVAADLGLERAFYKVAMRPGKPLMAGRLGEAALLGLPGNPVSSIVCGHLFMLPLLAAMQGLPQHGPTYRRATLAAAVEANGPRTHFMRATLQPGDGDMGIAPFDRQDSSLLSVLAAADALLMRPPNDGPRAAGDQVHYLPL